MNLTANERILVDAIAETLKAIDRYPDGGHPMTASEVILTNALLSTIGRDEAAKLFSKELTATQIKKHDIDQRADLLGRKIKAAVVSARKEVMTKQHLKQLLSRADFRSYAYFYGMYGNDCIIMQKRKSFNFGSDGRSFYRLVDGKAVRLINQDWRDMQASACLIEWQLIKANAGDK